jgi:hypothetical protein
MRLCGRRLLRNWWRFELGGALHRVFNFLDFLFWGAKRGRRHSDGVQCICEWFKW